MKTIISFAAVLLLSTIFAAQELQAGLIIDPQIFSSRINLFTVVTDSSFQPRRGSGDGLLQTAHPSPTSASLGPRSSSDIGDLGDSASASASLSYMLDGTSISSSGSVSSSASYGSGRNMVTGNALAVFGISPGSEPLLTVTQPTPFTLTTDLSQTAISHLVVTSEVLLQDGVGNILVDHSGFFATAPGSLHFTDSGVLLPGVQYFLTGYSEVTSALHQTHSLVTDSASFSFTLVVPEPSTLALAVLGSLSVIALNCRRQTIA